ncbi:MAG: formylglycine-generating enzyme family protein [Fibrobacterota bacterium]|nr:formylglycine-generating enzyme family protein [Fibrobacterota bacterium]QQS06410.1 MAG: formylglycine-generating enzyme family protein [Fibrobacterota bacterium]
MILINLLIDSSRSGKISIGMPEKRAKRIRDIIIGVMTNVKIWVFSACLVSSQVAGYEMDDDHDGVPNAEDLCLRSEEDAKVGADGCLLVLPNDKAQPPSGMAKIPKGYFYMGSTDGYPNERPTVLIRVKAFLLDRTEVTRAAFKKVMGVIPSEAKACGDDCPVDQVDWSEANKYCAKIGKRLPSEAEWEYAARAGWTSNWSWGNEKLDALQHAWFVGSSGGQLQPVGKKLPNAWGLYDMFGNASEWTADWFGDYVPPSQVGDPITPKTGEYRVVRGGHFNSSVRELRSALRSWAPPDLRDEGLGFRCATSK